MVYLQVPCQRLLISYTLAQHLSCRLQPRCVGPTLILGQHCISDGANLQPRTPDANPDTAADDTRHVSRTAERAAKKIQLVAKETDWHVAKAYADLASTPVRGDEARLMEMKRKELGGPSSAGGVEERALDAYMDDQEWEARERRLGRAPRSLLSSTVGKAQEKGEFLRK
jgi:hypothetical protein